MQEFSVAEMEERSRNFLVEIVKTYKIFIDTCSLLSEYAEAFWGHIIPILKEEKSSVIVPFRVYQEVEKYANDPELCSKKAPDSPNLNILARQAKKRIIFLHSQGLIKVIGEKTDNFADNVFQTVFTQYRMKYNLFLITQDKNLCIDINRISESKSVTVKNKITVRRINKHGYLSHLEINKSEPKKKETQKHIPQTEQKPHKFKEENNIPEDEIFALSDTVIQTSGPIHISYFPKEGDTVIAERRGIKKEILLVEAGNSGGEGTIFTTNIPNVVAKVYKPGKVDMAKYEKLRLMISKNINCPGVCFPIAMLYNTQNEFVGFLMKKAQGKELQKCLFIPQLLKKYFPQWKKKDTVNLCITILKKLKYLHDRNIILGDINPNNILVVSSDEVYFVDTDSYQIEGYPCPVGTINFTAPEIQRKKFDTFLRTIGNEQFAVATLLFMIMLPGKPPYSLQGGENQIDNIINGDFAYASGERTNKKAPEGVWRYIWSHLPRYLKDDFYETFRKGGTQNQENSRFSDDDWIEKFEHYAKLLEDEKGKFLSNDSMSAELFPNRLKKDANTTYITCKLCNTDVDEERTEQGYCKECLKKGETYPCERCGEKIVYTNYQKLIRHSRKFDICKSCNDKLNSIYRRYPCENPYCRNSIEITYRQKETLESKGKRLPSVCKDCRDANYIRARCSVCEEPFSITYGEKEYFENKGYELPKKCPDCRGNRSPYSNNRQTYSTHPQTTQTSSSQKKSGLCFITTAVCKYFNKPDDCYELTTLRKFRDEWLAEQPNGKALIAEYYDVAPIIVSRIDMAKNRDEIYMHIWNDYISPCIKLIELSAYEVCKDLYVDMVNELKKLYC